MLHDFQDAKKGVLFIDFPPVLQLQLKRFEYDFMRDTMVKVSSQYPHFRVSYKFCAFGLVFKIPYLSPVSFPNQVGQSIKVGKFYK